MLSLDGETANQDVLHFTEKYIVSHQLVRGKVVKPHRVTAIICIGSCIKVYLVHAMHVSK